jgi:hypothetical protein
LIAKLRKNSFKENKQKRYTFFKALYPTPEPLNITAGSATDFGMAAVQSVKYNDHTEIDKIAQYPWAKDMSREDLIISLTVPEKEGLSPRADVIAGQQAIDNIKKYGSKDWYDWNNKHWGTKWDLYTYEFDVQEHKLTINADSAWCPPLKGLEKVSGMYPLLYFKIKYNEPGCAIRGTSILRGGRVKSESFQESYS